MARTVKPSDERRQELLGIGLQLFMQNGSAGVSIQEVVQRANVATGLFYYYFKSKETFLEEAIYNYIIGNVGKILELLQNESIPLLQRIRNALSEFWNYASRLLPIMQEDALNAPQHYILMDGMLQRLCPAVQKFIEQGNREGIFHVYDSAALANFILYGLSGILHIQINTDYKDNYQSEVEKNIFFALGVSAALIPLYANDYESQ